MRLFSRKVLSALRRVSRARPTSSVSVPHLGFSTRVPPATVAPLLCAPVLFGTLLNPIIVDDPSDEGFVTDTANCAALTNSFHDLSVNVQETENPNHIAAPSQRSRSPPPHPTPATEASYKLVPITEYAENSPESADVCLHNLRHVANYHGFDLEEVHPDSGRINIGPTEESQSFLNNFDMGNDVDREDMDAVAMEQEIAGAHEHINMNLLAAMNTENTKGNTR